MCYLYSCYRLHNVNLTLAKKILYILLLIFQQRSIAKFTVQVDSTGRQWSAIADIMTYTVQTLDISCYFNFFFKRLDRHGTYRHRTGPNLPGPAPV